MHTKQIPCVPQLVSCRCLSDQYVVWVICLCMSLWRDLLRFSGIHDFMVETVAISQRNTLALLHITLQRQH
jgi:hypothetical protein